MLHVKWTNCHNGKCAFSLQVEEEDELESGDQDDEYDEDEDDSKDQGHIQLCNLQE